MTKRKEWMAKMARVSEANRARQRAEQVQPAVISPRVDLNRLQIMSDTGEGVPLRDFSTVSEDGMVEAVLGAGLHARLLRELAMAECVVGCVAWLTCFDILKALKTRRGVLVVVQKEDFLRPDVNDPSDKYWRDVRAVMDDIPAISRRSFGGGVVGSLNVCWADEGAAIRCVGNHNSDRLPTHPKMHHKFVVLCGHDERGEVVPRSVWTGSFNFTRTAARSRENAVILRSPSIARAYFNEFQQVYALSEPLDWETPYSMPQYQIGT